MLTNCRRRPILANNLLNFKPATHDSFFLFAMLTQIFPETQLRTQQFKIIWWKFVMQLIKINLTLI